MVKRLILFLVIIIALFGGRITSQTIFSNGTGGGAWSSQGTLLEGVVPNIKIDVLIFFY